MNFSELVTEVTLWAKAPHMDAGIRAAIRSVTLKYHRKEKFWRDISTVQLVGLPTTDFVQVINITANFPRFRQLLSVDGCEIVQPGDLLQQDGRPRLNMAILAGTSLNIKRSIAFNSIAVSYYQDPTVSPEGSYASWIADTQPDLIVCGAAARVLAWNAESEIYKAAVVEEQQQWIELLQNNIEGQGR